MTTAHPPLPTGTVELVYALLPTIAEDPDIVRKLAAGTATPSIQGLIRLRVAYEVSALFTEAGMCSADIRAWWMTPGVLNGVGEELSPVGLFRYGPLKNSATKILKAARAASGSTAEPYAWGQVYLVTLDVDGCLLPFEEFGSPVRTDELTALDFSEPPFTARRFYYDPAAVAAVNRWAASDGVLINWLTSWGPLAPRLLAPQLGLPAFGTFVTRTNLDVYRQRPWRRLALWDFLADELPPRNPIRLVCVDDRDMAGISKQLKGYRSEKLLDSLVIEPRSSIGISQADISKIDFFLSRNQAPGEPGDPPAAHTAHR